MTKTKSKPVVPPPVAKKGGDGGRISKSATKMEQTKATAKAVVATSQAAGTKPKGILKESNVCHRPVG